MSGKDKDKQEKQSTTERLVKGEWLRARAREGWEMHLSHL